MVQEWAFNHRQKKESWKQKKNAKSKGPKGSQGWNIENWFNGSGRTRNHGPARKLRILQKQVPLAIRGFVMEKVLTNGVRMDDTKVGKQTYDNSTSSCSPAWSRTCGVCSTQRCVTEEHEKLSACSFLCYQLSSFLQSYVRQLVTFASDKLFDMNRVFCIVRIVSAAHNMIVFFDSGQVSWVRIFCCWWWDWPEYNKKVIDWRKEITRQNTQCTINH